MRRIVQLLSVAFLAACLEASDVGYPCASTLPSPEGKDLRAPCTSRRWCWRVEAQAMDCEARLCVSGGSMEPQCSSPCAADDDCPGGTSHCREGFSCVVAVVVGAQANRRLCVCRGRLAGLTR